MMFYYHTILTEINWLYFKTIDILRKYSSKSGRLCKSCPPSLTSCVKRSSKPGKLFFHALSRVHGNSSNLCFTMQKWILMPSQGAIWAIKSFHRQTQRMKRANDTLAIAHQLSRNIRPVGPIVAINSNRKFAVAAFSPETLTAMAPC